MHCSNTSEHEWSDYINITQCRFQSKDYITEKVISKKKKEKKRSFHNDKVVNQENITILNICVPNNRGSRRMKQKLIEMQEEIEISISFFQKLIEQVGRKLTGIQ